MAAGYVHGYQDRERRRLEDQAQALVDLLHAGTLYPAGARVLEVGCGTGAQTVTLSQRSPGAVITSLDISSLSLTEAQRRCRAVGASKVSFCQADIFDLPFADCSFDHLFACFVLEHVADVGQAMLSLRRVLRPHGSVTVIEGDHGSAYFHPDNAAAREAIDCLVQLQRGGGGGNALIGRQLYPLLAGAGFAHVEVRPRMVYVDAARPDLAQSFTLDTFTAMVDGARQAAVEGGLIEAGRFDAGIAGLKKAAEPDGVFCYTFFKGTGKKPLAPRAEDQVVLGAT